MTIASLNPPEQLQLELEFIKPFKATNETVFRFERAGNGTTVTRVMTGQNGFMNKAISVFMDMDKLVGSDFEAGLATLKNLSEAEAKTAAQAAANAAPNGAVASDAAR